jgi:hypothetical protein
MENGIRRPSTALALRLRFGRDDKIGAAIPWRDTRSIESGPKGSRLGIVCGRFLTKRATGLRDRVLVRKPRKRR